MTEQLNALVSRYDLELIQWTDSYGVGSSWEKTTGIDPEPHHCLSVGWVVKETGDVVVVVPHISPANDKIQADEHGCGDMTIPKVAIQHREILRG